MNKVVEITGKKFVALVDTGSRFNYKPSLPSSCLVFVGFGSKNGQNETQSLAKFTNNLEIDDEDFEITFHVVPNDCIDVEVVLGVDLCNKFELIINASGIKIKKLKVMRKSFIKNNDDRCIKRLGY